VLELLPAVVVAADGPRLEVEFAGGEHARAWADIGLVGECEPGDQVIVNVQARRLGLGSGGFDVVHCNLTRGLGGAPPPAERAHVMKLNYTSLQHAVSPIEEGETDLELPLTTPVAVLALHGQLRPLAWAFAQAAPGARLAYVQTAGGALPGALSDDVRALRADGLLAAHVTAGPAYGGEQEAITTAAALHGSRSHDAIVAGPGPGILGSGSALGHGGLVALDTAHAALALGAPTLLVARMSEADPRERHRGLSHHTRTVRDLLLAPVTVPEPSGDELDGYPWATTSMGRDDPLFFAAAAAAGRALAAMMPAP
jgi:hypothetical protein